MADLEELTLEVLDEDQRQLAELIGIEGYRKLVGTYGGMAIYIPKADAFKRLSRDEEIRAKFDGRNYRQLAVEYGLTESWIRSIVSDISKQMRSSPVDGQINLFNETAS